jgi:hypothetical protein
MTLCSSALRLLATSLETRVAERVARFAGRPPPDREASLLDWYAWSLAARG